MKSRRVGTLTLGITLLAIGAVYMVHLFFPQALDLLFVLKAWPLIFILLGGEVLLSYFINKEEKLRYDGWAIFFIFCLMCFAWCLAGAEFLMSHNGYNINFPGYYYCQ